MPGRPDDAPRARVELVGPGAPVDLGGLLPRSTCDGELVDDLLRFDVAARRLGWRVRLRDVDQQLGEVLDLVGMRDRLA